MLCGAAQAQSPFRVGYAVLRADAGNAIPVGSALFSLRNSEGILVSEAGVGAVAPIRTGRIFVDQRDSQTGLAIANPGGQSITLDLTMRRADGGQFGLATLTLPAGGQVAYFVDEPGLFPTIPADFVGSLTFATRAADQRVAAVTIRQGLNGHGDPVFATLPVVDLDAPAPAEPALIFPHVGAGPGLSTQIVLINRGAQNVNGQIQLTTSSGSPLQGRFNGQQGSSFTYSIAANGVFQASLTSESALVQGFAAITAGGGGALPAGTAIFQFRDPAGRIVSEAGVGSVQPTIRSRVFVDSVGTQTGVALSNFGNPPQDATFELRDRFNQFLARTTRSLPANGHLAAFVEDLFGGLTPGFTGILTITAPSPVVPITLKLTTNQRAELILTTLPVADLERPSPAAELFFPQVGFGAAGLQISTRLVLISVSLASQTRGDLLFTGQDGAPLNVYITGVTGNDFRYRLFAGSAMQFRPENRAGAALILIDPENPFLIELPLSVGDSFPLRPVVLDTEGQFRDDFTVVFASLNPTAATVTALGLVRALAPGFSTLSVSAGGASLALTVSVVEVSGGVAGFDVEGVAADFAGRFYLAGSTSNTILLSEDLEGPPDVYAGNGDAGLYNDKRLDSEFNRPAFLALNQADGVLYVADSANHAIRRVGPGPDGRSETLGAANGAGYRDGAIAQALFNTPQGLALDSKGNLWIVDTGNHVIRRLNLTTQIVETVAGEPGVRGLRDRVNPTDPAARFDTPTGIAVEPVPLADQLAAFAGGQPPPPVAVVVTDSGNGAIRRVLETGQVSTVPTFEETLEQTGLQGRAATRWQARPVAFGFPTGVAADRFGSVYVSDPGRGAVFSVSSEGRISALAGARGLQLPKGLAISNAGSLVVADGQSAVRRIRFGGPAISSVSPAAIPAGGGQAITVTGENFSPETRILVGGSRVADGRVVSTRIIRFTAPNLPVGPNSVTVENRGGIADADLIVQSAGIGQLSPGDISTYAGGASFGRDGAPGARAQTSCPFGLTIDGQGILFVAERLSHRIRAVEPFSGVIRTVAGNGLVEPFADNVFANRATFSRPSDVAIDPSGNLYVADTDNHRIRRLDASTGRVTTYAGTGQPGSAIDGSQAVQQPLDSPSGIAFDRQGNLYIADTGNHRIRRVSRNGVITTVAGSGVQGFFGDNLPAIQARLNTPRDVAVDAAGNIYFTDTANHRVRRVSPDGFIFAFAGTGQAAFAGDGGPARSAALNTPLALAVDRDGNVWFADAGNDRIRRVDVATGLISTVAGGGCCDSGDGVAATRARLVGPSGLALDSGGNLYLSDTGQKRVRRVDARTGLISTVAGSGENGDGVPGAGVFLLPFDVAFDPAGNLLIADRDGFRVRRIDAATGNVSTVAGNGLETFLGSGGGVGDGGPATSATVGAASGVATDSLGNLYIADPTHHRIRRVDARTGVISTFAGTGEPGFFGNGVPATEAQLNSPLAVAVDRFDTVYISDNGNNLIRVVSGGVIQTLAGHVQAPNAAGATGGAFGDGGAATNATLLLTVGGRVVVDSTLAVYIADTGHDRIRRIRGPAESRPGTIETVAFVDTPLGVALDPAENLFVSIRGNRVLRVLSGGVTQPVAGLGSAGFSGDGGPAPAAQLNIPVGIAFDKDGNLFVADSQNRRIRVVVGPGN